MSWDSKQDYAGLAVANKVICKSANVNTSGQYLEKLGAHGNIAATKPFGVVSAPSNEYTIKAANTFQGLKLGSIVTVDGHAYALESIHYEKSAGAEPVLTATTKEVETGATTETMNTFALPDIAVNPDEIAELIVDCATLSGTGCELTKCAADFACTVNTHNVNALPQASDVVQGKITVQLTIGQYSTTAPTVAAKAGWDISSPLTCNDPDSDMPEWTCTLSKPLAKTLVSAS
ncbi:MAG: hypothetical protein IKO64_05605 [Kiritimatiellae bacterium]|nr:hypothetical protein [Kiritimatiellia bacterium]